MKQLLVPVLLCLSAVPAAAQPDDWYYESHHDGVHLRILRDYRLAEGAVVREPVVVIGGSATIDGRVEHDIAVIGGQLRIGPKAVIEGDIVTVGSEPVIDPAATIGGTVERATVLFPDVALGPIVTTWWPILSMGTTLLRLLILFIVALLLTVVAPSVVRTMAGHAGSATATSALYGVAGQVLFVPVTVIAVVALVISIIGIPLLLAFPFLMAAAVLFWIAGFSGVAIALGASLRRNRADTSDAPVWDLMVGFALIAAVTLIAQAISLTFGWIGPFGWMVRALGWTIEWAAWTVGLGAALTWFFGRRQPATPPLPWAAPAPSVL